MGVAAYLSKGRCESNSTAPLREDHMHVCRLHSKNIYLFEMECTAYILAIQDLTKNFERLHERQPLPHLLDELTMTSSEEVLLRCP